MVLIRKWGVGETAEEHGDYPIFMAIADKVGHNKRGNALYKRAPDGSLLLHQTITTHRIRNPDGSFEEVQVASDEPIIDDELDEIASEYHSWLAQQLTPARKRNAPSKVA